MNIFEISIIMILSIIALKIAAPLIIRITSYKENKIKFNINIKRESIKKMTDLEFEYFCKWLFENDPKYIDVELPPISNDDGVNLILTSTDKSKIYVECRRHNVDSKDKDFVTSRLMCERLVGAMVSNNIKKGIILTTGNINSNALNYINKLRANTNINLEILTVEGIIKILEERQDNNEYSIAIEI
ncbi:hypothetical protein JCM1393_19430 [Clostridium carnis]